ncbi:DMT family transporter [Paenibacillus bouchesdurhonensis]|uniref:DMT family transporter n=1 Tax=Paenibacillus bouchesdurhonensis TaxID=1870990 RepID=UPI000DA614B7|nr:multidrug efflux SMR transporter [Paenibacillus bouchesdurhonensis]
MDTKMNRYWGLVLVAGLFEIGWVIGLKHSHNVLTWTATAVAIFVSMYLLVLSTRKLPTGTAYAVFTGIGTSGTVILEMIVFGEPFKLAKLLLIMLLVCGVAGLKLVTTEQDAQGGH